MVLRRNRVERFSKTEKIGVPQLSLAHVIILGEKILTIFARPLMLLAGFIILAWFGVFEILFPWAHLIALIIFTILLFDALGQARLRWKPIMPAEARRRVEEASHLQHRPLDVVSDRPVLADLEQMSLWQIHAARARQKLNHLQWPRWKADFWARDPYATRYALVILLAIGGICGWGILGGRLIDSINPALGKRLHMFVPTLDAWITPPEYTGLPPIMIATPADMRHGSDVIDIPEGSTINAHLAEKDGNAPVLVANGDKTEFTTDSHGDFEAAADLKSGDTITIRRGWQTLGSWHIRIVPDTPPKVAFSEAPSVSERKSIRLPYEASDDYGITSVIVRVTPRQSLPGAHNDPVEIPLAEPNAKQVKRINFEDLTSHPWAGLPVTLTLIATDAAGHTAESKTADLVLPERQFFQPVARALIDERKKLLQQPDDEAVRNETANIMAAVAHQPDSYHGDPVVLMALRSGAVRLVLDHDHDSAVAVNDILWQSAVRIESGGLGMAEQNLHDAQKELADALDHNATEDEIQNKIDRLHQALAQYLAQLATRVAQHPPMSPQDLSQILGPQTNMLTPKDLEQMLNNIRDLSATNARDAARQQLAQLQQMLENINADPPQITEAQKQQMKALADLHALVHDQQQLLDKTFRDAEKDLASESAPLSLEQKNLLQRLNTILMQAQAAGKSPPNLQKGADAMQHADQDLQQKLLRSAVPHQGEAIQNLQKAEQSMAQDLRATMMMLPGGGGSRYGQNNDPTGRKQGFRQDENGVKIPDQMETLRVREIMDELQRRSGDMGRSKTERDYIERLLQNF